MDFFKRPMLYAAIVCCIISAMALFSIDFIYFLLLSVAFFLYIIFKFKKYKYITVILAVLLFVGSVFVEANKIDRIKSYDKQIVSGEFLIVDEPEEYENFNYLTFKAIECSNLPSNTRFIVFDNKKTDISFGDYIYATLKINAIDNNDEYFLYDYSNGIYATANLNEAKILNKTNTHYKLLADIRGHVKTTILDFFEGDTAGLMLAVTTGDKGLMSDKLLNNVKETGISHVIVVSGMHLSIIMYAVFLIIDKAFYNKYIRALLSMLIVLIICGVCGYSMSVIRAAIMFLIGGFAPIFNRDKDLLSSLLTAIVIVLTATPFAVANISFLLSVLSTLSIIWVVPFYTNLLVKKFSITSQIAVNILQMVLVSVFAMFFTLPVIINTFGYVSILAPLTNILVTYPVTFALIFNCIGLCLYPIPVISVISKFFIYIAGALCDLTINIVNCLSKLPITIAILPKQAFLISILLIFIVISYMFFYENKLKSGK